MIRTFVDGGINWNWYLQADINEEEKTAHIFFFDRWHKYEDRGSRHPKHENTSCQLVEDDKRIVTAIRIPRYGTESYRVTNPAHVFSYRDMTHYEAE